eukprot:2823557-Ditylum_brightwellii.AAC.1
MATVAHAITDHIGEAQSLKIVKYLGYTVSRGIMPKYEPCTKTKAKQKSLLSHVKVVEIEDHPKEYKEEVNERMHLDISTVKVHEKLNITVVKPQLLLMVEEHTGMKWTALFQNKNGMVDPTCVKLNKWKQGGKTVKYIRLDNADTNKELEKQCESALWKLGIEFEYTG